MQMSKTLNGDDSLKRQAMYAIECMFSSAMIFSDLIHEIELSTLWKPVRAQLLWSRLVGLGGPHSHILLPHSSLRREGLYQWLSAGRIGSDTTLILEILILAPRTYLRY